MEKADITYDMMDHFIVISTDKYCNFTVFVRNKLTLQLEPKYNVIVISYVKQV